MHIAAGLRVEVTRFRHGEAVRRYIQYDCEKVYRI